MPGILKRSVFFILVLVLLAGPGQADDQIRTIAGFDFKGGLLENGFGSWQYSDIGDNACQVYKGIFQSYLCKKDRDGQMAVKLHYLTYNNDHMGWLRWGYLDAENQLKIRGSSLKIVLTGGAWKGDGEVRTSGKPIKSRSQFIDLVDRDINPYADRKLPGDATLYFKTRSSTTRFDALQGMDRIALWVLMPRPGEDRFQAQQYTRRHRSPAFTFSFYPFIDDSRGGHYYHGITNIPMGGWIRVEFDAHPYHYNGGDKNPYAQFRAGGYAAPGDAKAYFARMVTFAFRALDMKDRPSPTAFCLDEITAYSRPYENQETISSLAIGFDPWARRFDISLTDKYRCLDCRSRYEVRYAFDPITQAGFETAIPCQVVNFDREKNNTAGLIYKPNKGYNQIWAGLRLGPKDEVRLKSGTTVYFAVKDVSDRTNLPDRDPHDDDLVPVPGAGLVRQKDLIRTLAYTIYPVPWPLAFQGVADRYALKLGVLCDLQFSVSGGTAPYFFYASDGMPPGLFLESSGAVTGTPTRAGTFSPTVFAVDSENNRISRQLILEIQGVKTEAAN